MTKLLHACAMFKAIRCPSHLISFPLLDEYCHQNCCSLPKLCVRVCVNHILELTVVETNEMSRNMKWTLEQKTKHIFIACWELQECRNLKNIKKKSKCFFAASHSCYIHNEIKNYYIRMPWWSALHSEIFVRFDEFLECVTQKIFLLK